MHRKFPVFILGNPRSGTSLFRIMLTCHPEICIPPECGFIQWWYEKYQNWSEQNSMNKSLVKNYINDLKKSKKIETWNLNYIDLEKLIYTHRPGSYSELCYLVYIQYMYNLNKDAKIVGDKNNYYINHLDLLDSIFPNANYILIVRDGRDVACSYRSVNQIQTQSLYKPKLPHFIDDIAIEWNNNNQNIINFFNKINKKRWSIIKYEDLLTKPQKYLEKICNFLEISFHGEMLNFYDINGKLNLEPTKTLGWKLKTLKPLDVNNIGKYRCELKDGEISRFEKISSKSMSYFGYI